MFFKSNKPRIKKARQENFSANIWKIIADASFPYLILEVREYQSRSVFFSVYDLKKLKFVRKKIYLDETWWVSIEQCKNGLILFHGFKDDHFALHEGIKAYDIVKDQILWQAENYTFHYYVEDGIIVSDEDDNFLKVNSLNGKLIDKNPDLHKLPKEEESNITLTFPANYLGDTEYFSTVSRFLHNKKLGEPVKTIEYMEIKNFFIISYYILDQNLLSNKLAVFDLNGNFIFEDVIDQNLKGVGAETFFIYENLIIYIKQKNQLHIYEMA